MTPLEIHNKIDENNRMIQSLLSPNIFTLNNVVSNLIKENQNLQKQCPHSFVDGFCEYCYKGEE